jgi:hypothetical protein
LSTIGTSNDKKRLPLWQVTECRASVRQATTLIELGQPTHMSSAAAFKCLEHGRIYVQGKRFRALALATENLDFLVCGGGYYL